MAAEGEVRETSDGTEAQAEVVDLGTVHLEAHPEGKLSSIMDIKNVGEIINSTEGTLKIPEDQVLVEAPSEIQLPPEHNLNGEECSLNGHMEVEEKISNEQLHDNDQEEGPDGTNAHQSNRINKEEVIDGYGESITEDSSILKCKKDEEPKGDNQQDLGVTVDNESVQEETLTSDGATEQTDDGQQDQTQEPEKANKDTQPASIADNVNVEVVTEAPKGLQTPAEPNLDDSDAIPEIIDEKTKTYEQTKADGAVHPGHEESFLEDTTIAEPTEAVVKVSDQRSQQADTMAADVVQEEMLKCEETSVQEEVPKSEAHGPIIDAQEVLNQESAQQTVPMDENIEETVQQSNVAAPKETTPEHEATTRVPPVNIQVQNQESLEEIEEAEAVDIEAEMQQNSVGFEDATPDDRGVTMDDDMVQETLKATEQKDDGQQDQDLEPEKTAEDSQPASMANIPDVEVVAEAHSGVQTPMEPNQENSDAIPDSVDVSTETNEPGKADSVVHHDHKESFPEDTSIAEPTDEVVKVEDQQSKQANAMDADVVQEKVPKSEHFDEPETDANEMLNQEPAEETDSTVNEKTEETTCQSNMATPEETTPEHDSTREPPVNIQEQSQESLEEREDAEAVDTEAPMQQSGVAFAEAVPEDQHNLGATVDDTTVQENTLEAIEQTEDGQQYQDLGPENATENTQPESTESIPDVEVVDEAPSGVQAPVEINLDTSDAIPDTTDGNTETDEPAKADGVIHPDHKESFREDISVAEPTEEVVKVEDQQSQQADAIDADVLQEEVPKSEHADELANNAQEILKESAEETDVPVNEKTEEAEHKSNMASPEETMPEHDVQAREPPVNIQLQNEEPLGEIEDAEAVDTEAEMKQSSVAFEETTPEDNVATTEPHSDIQHINHVEPEEINSPGDAKDEEITTKSNTENAVQDNVLQSRPTADIHPVQELEQTESKSAGIYEMDEASDQNHAVVLSDLAQEDATVTSEPQVTKTEKDLEDTEATEEITEQDHVTPSKELSIEDDLKTDEPHNDDIQQTLEQDLVEIKDSETYHEKTFSTSEETVEANVTAEEPTSDGQEADNAESTEETKKNIAENIAEVSDVVIVDEEVQQNVPQTEDIAETHTRELEAEETKSTEPIESEEASDQRNAAPFNDSAQEDNTLESEMQQMESSTEIKETEAVPQESNACVSEEPSPEDHILESETNCDTKEVSITESSEVIDNKDIITGSISGQSDMVSAGDSAQETNVTENEAPAVIQAVQESGSEETKKTELEEVKEKSHEMNAIVFQTPTQEDNPGTTELHESTEVSNIEATEEQGTPHQSAAAAQSEEQATEEIAREPQILEPESVEEINDTEANKPQNIFQKNIISTPEESVPEEIATEDSVTTEPDIDHQQVPDQESSEVKDIEADKPYIVPVQELEQTESKSAGIYEMDEASDQTHAVVLSDLAQEDATATSEPQANETEKDLEDTEATEEITEQDHVAPSKELSVEDDLTTDEPHNDDVQQTLEQDSVEIKDSETYHEKTFSTSEETVEANVTAEEPTSDGQEADNAESTEETKENIAENIAEVSDVVIVDEEVQQNVPQTEDIAETHTRELEAEETKSTEPIESEEASDQRNAAPFNDSAQEDNTLESEMQQMESSTEIKETEAVPQESNAFVSEEPSPEDHILESETNCDTKEVSITESSEVIDNKDIITGSISGQSDMVSAGDSAQETNVTENEAPAVIQAVQESGSEKTKKTELEEVKEKSHEMNAIAFQTPTQEDNPGTTELHESTEVSNIEATEEQGTPHQSAAAAQSEEQATEEIAREPQILEPESVEEINDTEANKPQNIFQKNIISTPEESVPEEIATEDNVTTEPDIDHQQVQDQESSEVKDIEADKPQEIASSSALTSEESTSDDNATEAEPSSDTQADNSQSAEVTEDTENLKSNTALAETAAPETEATTDRSPVHEAELEETKDNEPIITEDSMTLGDLPSEKIDMETMETEAVSHESHVASIKELSEDDASTSNAPHADDEPVLEESVEDTTCTDTTEHSGEPNGSTSDEPILTEENTTVTEQAFNTQELQDVISQEIKDSEEGKTDELSDISSFPTPEETHQEINSPRTEPTHDVQEVQELGSTEETRDIETVEPEDHQEHRVFTLEQPAVDSGPNADDQQVHGDKLPEMKDNEAVEAEEATKQSNIATTDNTAEETSGLESDPDSYVLVSQHIELSKDNENSQIVNAEETSGPSKSVALEERITEDSVASEIELPIDIKHDNEQEPVEETEGVDATEAEEDFDKSQADTVEKLASEHNTATIEPTYDIQQADDLEATIGMKNTEAISDGEQSKGAASEEPTPTDNGGKAEEHPVESNEGIMENETDNVIVACGIKDEIQESVELKDQYQKEDEKIEELQVDEQKSEDKGDDLTTEPLREYQNIECGATNRKEDNEAVEAEQTKAAITEITKNEQALHISEESTPIIVDTKVESVKETTEGTEEDDDAKNDRKDRQENEQNDGIAAKNFNDDQGKTTDEITNEELEHGLASSVQEASDPAPSNGKILENDPVAITLNVESGEHRECTIKVNDDVHTIQASEEEVTDKIEENEGTQNEDNAIHHDELETKPEKEEAPQLCSNEPRNMDSKIDDTTPLCEEKVDDNASIKPRKIEEIGENKGLDSISEPFAESSIQNNAEQDLSSHHKVEDERLSMAVQNAIDIEAVQEKIDEPASDVNETKECQEETNTDDVLNLETIENPSDKIEETVSHETTETSNTTATEAVTINEDITDKANGADVAPSDESLKIFNDIGRDLDVSSVITAPKEDNMSENMEEHNLDLPEHPAQDDDTPEQALCLEQTERGMPSSEKLLQNEPEENQIPNEQDEEDKQDENQILKEKNDEGMQDTETGDAQKEVEQDLPVSSFLMNLILGKEIGGANGNLESEAEMKQGDTEEEESYTLICKQEESLGPLPTENKVDDNLTFEQEKHEVKCSEETHEMIKEQSDDLKLDTEISMETDEEFNKNTHDLEIPADQDNPQDKICGELLSEEEAGISTKMESRDIDISSIELDDRAVDTVCQENVEASAKSENGSLRSNLNDSTNTQASEDDTLVEGQTGLLLVPLPEDRGADGVSEQVPLFTQSGMTDANDLSSDTESVQNPVCVKQDRPTESSNIEVTSSPDIQMENEIIKKEEEKHANTATGEVSEESVENTDENLPKSSSSEVVSDEQATLIAESASGTQIILAHEKEISERSACMDEKENLQTEVEIQVEGPNMQIDQDKQDEAADTETVIEPEKLGKSNFQEHQKTGVEQSPKESDEGDQQVLAKKEILTKEQDVHGTVESPKQTVSIKSNEKQELFDSKIQERDLNVVSPREVSETEENFVDVTKPQFSTDEEQSPKPDIEEKIKDIEGTRDFTDEAAMKTEAPGAPQKAHKKHNLLSGVGSKVKHQLAKVKKAIVGKPGHTKPESPKS